MSPGGLTYSPPSAVNLEYTVNTSSPVLTATIQPCPGRGRGSHAFPVEVTRDSDAGLLASGETIKYFVDIVLNNQIRRLPAFEREGADRIGFSTRDGSYSIPAVPPLAGNATEYTLDSWIQDLDAATISVEKSKSARQRTQLLARIIFPAA